MSPEGFETRYTTELANEYGNLASRTLAMIGRYRDGVVPRGRAAGRAGERSSTAWPTRCGTLLDRVEVTRGARGDLAAGRALNRFVQDEEPWKLAKDEAEAAQLDRCSTGWPRGCAWSSVLLHAVRARGRRAAARRARAPRTARSTARGFGAVGGGARSASSASSSRGSSRRGRRCGLSAAVVDTHCHLDSCKPPTASSSRARAAAGVGALATVGMDGDVDRARARGGGRARGGVRDRRPPPATRRRASTTRDLEEIERGGRRPAGARDRRDRPRLLPRLRAARRPAARVRGADRPGRAARAAAGHPHARGRGGHVRDAARARGATSP